MFKIFCNLEKTHYIISKQQFFNKSLHSSTNAVINDEHTDIFLNDEYPFITKISEYQKANVGEWRTTEQECPKL